MSLLGRCKKLFEAVKATPARRPGRIRIPSERVDRPQKLGERFRRNEHYFQVRVNEMFLANDREWFKTYYPMVFVASEFLYGHEETEETEIPFVVGPSLLGERKADAHGMVFSNTRVAGIHPYRGGRLNLSLILYKVPDENLAKNLLGMVENLAGSLDFSSAISAYVKVAGALLDGVETLTGLGDTRPLVGHRTEIDPDAGDDLEPGYYALVDTPEAELDTDSLWVKESRLYHGPDSDHLEPYRGADYVLYSLSTTPERSDVSALPFYSQWARVVKEAVTPRDDTWDSAKANMISLYQNMLLSPDLVPDHARALAREYVEQMKKIRSDAVDMANLGGKDGAAAKRKALYAGKVEAAHVDREESEEELAAVRDESLAVLEL